MTGPKAAVFALCWCVLPLACAAKTTSPTASPQAAVCPVPTTEAPSGVETTRTVPAEATAILLQGGRLIDGTGGSPREGIDVLLRGDEIAEIGKGIAAPAGAKVVALGGRAILPGFIDAHVHLTHSPAPNYPSSVMEMVQSSEADEALVGARNAHATLMAGFTTVRNVGGGFADRSVRDAIRKGRIPGPRVLVANYSIGITGGHCDHTNTLSPEVYGDRYDWHRGVANGPDEVRKAVRYQIKQGADVIKICATGGVMSQGDGVGAPQLSLTEMKVAVDEAVRADRKVAAHAHGNLGIREAVQAGVHSIEHGSILDAPTVAMMKKRGTYLVPTLYVGKYVEQRAKKGKLSADSAGKALEIAPKMRRSFKLAYDRGVKIALGSDAGVFDHGDNGREFKTMVDVGMKPMDAIVAGTSAAAELLGLSNVGTVKTGNLADLVIIDGDPLTDIGVLERPAMVIKGGVIHLAPTWDGTR